MSTEARIEALEREVADLKRIIGAIASVFTGGGGADAATDRELDQQWGDPDVKIIPRDWTAGGVAKGQKFSRCPAEFLDLLAETMDYFATKNDAAGAKDSKGRPKSHYDKKNARFARGWARRLRSGWTPPAPTGLAGSGGGLGAPTGGLGGGGGFGIGGGFGTSRAAPPPPSSAPPNEPADEDDDPTSFNFGANVKPKAAPTTLPDDDDDAPLM